MALPAVALLCALWQPAHASSAISLEDILRSVRARPENLALRPELVTDPYRLKVVTRMLENPASALTESQAAATGILKATPEECLASMAERVEFALPASSSPAAGKLPSRAVPEELKGPLSILMPAIAQAQRTVDEALKDLPQEKRRALLDMLKADLTNSLPDPKRLNPGETWLEKDQELLALAGSVRVGEILSAGRDLVRAIQRALPGLKTAASRFHPEEKTLLQTPYGKVVLGSVGPDVFDEEAALFLDFGGDDVYQGAATQSRPGAVQVIIDLAGDDRYFSKGFGGVAAGIFGISIVVDAAGDDAYVCEDGSQGAGLFGFGLLWDLEGNDVYQARSFSQGAAAFGVGLLLDDQGTDLYRASFFSQGAGYIKGGGLLRDLSGNDTYLSGFSEPDPRGAMESYGKFRQGEVFQSLSQGFGMGWRDMAGGGVGFLIDGSGNDHYVADYFGQGSGYWFGWGMLYDASGNDTYAARRYAQGAGVHFAVGTLLDASGNDNYQSWTNSQGLGHDYALGVLWDGAGDDSYSSDWNVLGYSNAAGIGIFLDQSGSDRYAFNPHGAAMASFDDKRSVVGIGLFLDSGEETNSFGVQKGSYAFNASPWSAGLAGGNIAWGKLPVFEPPAADDSYRAADEKEGKFLQERLDRAAALGERSDLSELLAIASGWGINSEVPLKAKRAFLAAEPSKALPIWMQLLNPHSVFARMTLEEYFLSAPEESRPALEGMASSPDEVLRSRAAYYLGQLRTRGALPRLLQGLKDPSWRVRAAAARALGVAQSFKLRRRLAELTRLLDKEPALSDLIRDMEKSETLWLLSQLGMARAQWPELAEGLSQDKTVPAVAAKAAALLAKNPDAARKAISNWSSAPPEGIAELELAASDANPEVRRWALYSLALLDAKPGVFIRALKDSDYAARETSVLALSQLQSKASGALKDALASGDWLVKACALKALSALDEKNLRPLFERTLRDPDGAVRLAALQALAEGERAGRWKIQASLLRDIVRGETDLWTRGLAQNLLEGRP